MDLGIHGEMRRPRSLDWPSVADAKDWWMLDLALGAEAIVTWDHHLLGAAIPFGVEVLTPPRLLAPIERFGG